MPVENMQVFSTRALGDPMEDGELFRDLKLRDIPLAECEVAYESRHHRLYVVKGESKFYATAVSFVSRSDRSGDLWEDPELGVEVIFEVVAYFDGVRHLHFNTKDSGYLYYPAMGELIAMLEKVREIERIICSVEYGPNE